MSDWELHPSEIASGLDEIEIAIKQREARRARLAAMSNEELAEAEAAARAEQEGLYINPPDSLLSGSGIVEPEDLPYFAQLSEDLADIALVRATRLGN